MANIVDLSVGSTITINFSAGGVNEINWDSFEFVPITGQTYNASCKELTTVYGTAKYTNKSVIYTLTDDTPGCNADIIHYKIADVLGDYSKIKTIPITFNTIPAPVASELEVCTTCYNYSEPVDLKDYVTGDVESVEIVTQPLYGELILDGTVFTYIQNPNNNTLEDEFTYKAFNKNGISSNTESVFMVRGCLSKFTVSTVDITCLSKTFNLYNLLSTSAYINTGTWSVLTPSYTTQGGTLTNGLQGTVNFTSITPGTYSFKISYTLASTGKYDNTTGCPKLIEETVNIVHTVAPSLTITSSTLVSGNTYMINFTTNHITSPNNITVTNNSNPVNNFVVYPQLAFGSGYFSLQLPQGTNIISVSGLSNCNTTVTTATTIIVP